MEFSLMELNLISRNKVTSKSKLKEDAKHRPHYKVGEAQMLLEIKGNLIFPFYFSERRTNIVHLYSAYPPQTQLQIHKKKNISGSQRQIQTENIKWNLEFNLWKSDQTREGTKEWHPVQPMFDPITNDHQENPNKAN